MPERVLKLEKVAFRFEGKDLQFAILNRQDEVQQYLAHGQFYEIEQLLIHRHLIPKGGVVLDIGANVGNHTVFYSLFCNTKLVLPVEPMPDAAAMLKTSLQLNGCKNVPGNFIGVGCGAIAETRYVYHIHKNNLAATELRTSDEAGDNLVVKVIPGDEMIPSSLVVDFAKIDVENMELEVLAGLDKTIRRCRPAMSVEVGRNNGPAFHEWVNANNYRIEKTFHMYRGVRTFLLVPLE